ncbi:Tyrosine decarboxylase 1 [Platanthera guangdongensis]|uniref:Tyrosine decarboxylase 1 n=1 Tax=Platanthera guangdongensis TaxID=2320717 RepID=A0ABR2LNU4_9ASPA
MREAAAASPLPPTSAYGVTPSTFVHSVARIRVEIPRMGGGKPSSFGASCHQGPSPSSQEYYASEDSIINKLRRLWPKGLPVPWMPLDADPDLDSCLLHQQLQIEIVEFLAGLGGGVIQGTSSEAILVSLFAARDKILRKDGNEYLSKLTVYASDQTHSALNKACQLEQFTDFSELQLKHPVICSVHIPPIFMLLEQLHTILERIFNLSLNMLLLHFLFAVSVKPRKSNLSYPTDDDDVEEETDDQVVPDGVEEVECKNST